ncbi:mitogen-activated protein kinase kinase 9 [Prunus yedoensis var. nudiflora]|uniref:Mitogen-activated protein kinase kinase 9 n=1 Tax=Prunus yedoensis var. nudiflora TaxID=2094558 RepID=A0A314UDE7_PRUYE|nr:mitogen-activated protein kinase kinase 9 [Prunus yedoensis var. nudiflora]
MALIRQRRQLNLRLPLPEPSECCPYFSVPLPPTTTVTTAVTNNSSFGAISAVNLEKLQVSATTSTTYALKLVHGDSVRRQPFREMEILHRTDSPHVVRCHAIFEKPLGDIGIPMEYTVHGLRHPLADPAYAYCGQLPTLECFVHPSSQTLCQ